MTKEKWLSLPSCLICHKVNLLLLLLLWEWHLNVKTGAMRDWDGWAAKRCQIFFRIMSTMGYPPVLYQGVNGRWWRAPAINVEVISGAINSHYIPSQDPNIHKHSHHYSWKAIHNVNGNTDRLVKAFQLIVIDKWIKQQEAADTYFVKAVWITKAPTLKIWELFSFGDSTPKMQMYSNQFFSMVITYLPAFGLGYLFASCLLRRLHFWLCLSVSRVAEKLLAWVSWNWVEGYRMGCGEDKFNSEKVHEKELCLTLVWSI